MRALAGSVLAAYVPVVAACAPAGAPELTRLNVALWAVQGPLAFAFLSAWSMKLFHSRDEIVSSMGWVNEFSEAQLRLIGVAEMLGAIGLVVPLASGIAPMLTPIAAACLAALMAGATVMHIRRKERPATEILLGVLSTVVAVGRFALG